MKLKLLSGVLLAAGGLMFSGCVNDPIQPARTLSSHAESIHDGWVQLYDEKDMAGERVTLRYPSDVRKLEDIETDEGNDGFEDKTSSVKWCIPKGWSYILFENPLFGGEQTELKGNGEIQELRDLDKHNHRENQASSGRWQRNTDN